MTMKTRVLRASTWSSVDIIARQATAFVFSIALARILAPADFGVAALAIMCSAIAIAAIQTGLVTWLVSRPQTTNEEENTAFWLSLVVSTVLAAILIAASSPFARFFGFPILRPLLLAAAAQVFFASLGVVQTGLLTRSLAMKRLAVAGIVSGLVSGALSIFMALSGAGAMSIVVALAANSLANTILLWLLCTWRPSLPRSSGVLRSHLPFLRNLGAANLLEAFYGNVSNALLGKLSGAYDLGLFNRAQGTQQLPGNMVLMAASRVMLPVFVDSKQHPERLRQDVVSAVHIVMMITVPAMATLAAAADLVIETLFGAKWLPAAPVLSILAIGGALIPLHMVNLQYMLAEGRSDKYLRVETTKKILGIGLIALGSLRGIYGVAAAQAAYSVIALFINARLAGKILDYGALKQLGDTVPAAAIGLILGLTTLVIKSLVAVAAPIELLLVLLVTGTLFLLLVAITGKWLEHRGAADVNLVRMVWNGVRSAPQP